MNLSSFEILIYICVVVLILFLAASARAQEKIPATEIQASGGNFTLEKAVVAGGGREKQTGSQNEHGTTGQTIAGNTSSGGNFRLYSGFWTPENFAPTASTVSVGGRILTANGNGIRNVIITMTAPSGESRAVRSGSFGYYRFNDVAIGETYVFSISAKRYKFNITTQLRTISEETQDINFIAADEVFTKEN